jgi:hypothetical protein
MQALAGQHDGSIELVGQASVATADLHGHHDQFRGDAELGGEGRVDIGVAQREADGAVGRDDLEEDGEDCKGLYDRVRRRAGVGEMVRLPTGSLAFSTLWPSMQVMTNSPKNMYHKSKLSCFRK